MSSDRSQDVRRILSRLGRLRARIRAIFATIGIARWLVYAVGLLALFFVADRLLDLPLGVRRFVRLGLLQPPPALPLWVLVPLLAATAFLAVALTRRRHGAAPLFAFVAGGLAGIFAYMAVRVFQPLHAALPDGELALSVESRFGHLHDRLAAALDFERELRAPSRGESTAMMEQVVHEAAEAARGLSFSKAVSGRRALRWSAAAAGVLALATAVGAAMPEDLGLWARRSLLLEDLSWPRNTNMLAVDAQPDGSFLEHDPARPYAVPIGRSLIVYAQAQGRVPDDAQVLDLVAGQDPLARRMFEVPGKPGVFAYEFLDVRRPFAFLVRGGDDDDDKPRYEVEITIPPRVLGITSTITFPEYLEREPERVDDGSVTVPEGSRVAVVFETDVEIAKAQAVLGDEVIDAEAIPESAGRRFRFAYEASDSRHGRLVLATPDGKGNDPAADSFEVRVKSDAPPRVDWIWPRASLEVTPAGRLPLLARTGDDHGVAGLALEVRINDEDPQRVELQAWTVGAEVERGPPTAVNDGDYGRQRVLTYLPVEMEALRRSTGESLAPQDSVAFRLTAQDSRGQTRQSNWMRADVNSAPALERALATQRANVRTAIEAVRREQQSRRDDVEALRQGALGRAEFDLLKSVRFAQSKIAQDADRAVQELTTVFNGFVYDRLGSQNANARILSYLDRHHRRSYGLEAARSDEPPVRPTTDRSVWKGDPVFPYALYDEIVQAWRDKQIYDKGLLDKMCAALADAVEVGARSGPAAHQAAAAAVSGEMPAVLALRDAQDSNLQALDRLLESMRGWKSLSDVTIELRSVIDEQSTLIKEMEARDGNAEGRDPKKEESK